MSMLTALMVTLMLPGVSSVTPHQPSPTPAVAEVPQELSVPEEWDRSLLSSDSLLAAREPEFSEESVSPVADDVAEELPVLLAQNDLAVPAGAELKPASVGPIALMATPSAMAAMRPNFPPAEKPVHSFWDRTNVIGFAVHGAVRIADAAQSCALLSKPGRREAWLPVHSCSGIATYSLAMIPAQIGTSYVMHKRGHHQMERWVPYFWAAPSAAGVTVSLKAW